MSNNFVHVEFAAEDPKAASEFYAALFGWKIEKAPGPMDYWMVQTAPEGEGVAGGMMQRQVPQQQILVYFQVESADEFAAKVTASGGQVVMAKHAVPGMGWFAVCLDPQNNAFALWQDDKSAA